MPELTLFSYEIMGLVGHGGPAPHDLPRLAQRGRIPRRAVRGVTQRALILEQARKSHYTVDPKRLAKLGYLEARKEPGRTRPRTVYTLTDKGLDALRQYARTPRRLTPLQSA